MIQPLTRVCGLSPFKAIRPEECMVTSSQFGSEPERVSRMKLLALRHACFEVGEGQSVGLLLQPERYVRG